MDQMERKMQAVLFADSFDKKFTPMSAEVPRVRVKVLLLSDQIDRC